MAWEHKGINIESTPSGQFMAMFEGVSIIKASLDAVKNDINRRQSMKAAAVQLNLRVVILRVSDRFSYKEENAIAHAVITGLDPESRTPEGIQAPKGWKNDEILPDSKDNTKRLEALIAARAELKRAEKAIEGREVSLWIPSAGRNKPIAYGDAVKRILDNYEAANKAKAE